MSGASANSIARMAFFASSGRLSKLGILVVSILIEFSFGFIWQFSLHLFGLLKFISEHLMGF
jgi:hypothetical protein